MSSSNPVDSDSPSVSVDAPVNFGIPKGCVKTYVNLEHADENDETERVGVLDYVPNYKHRSLDIKCNENISKTGLPSLKYQTSNSCAEDSFKNAALVTPGNGDIELKTFSISESHSSHFDDSYASFHDARCSAPASSCLSDDELLVPAEDALQEVVVQLEHATCVGAPSSHANGISCVSSQGLRGVSRMSAADREVAASLHHIPPSFGITRDAARSNPDAVRMSPTNSPEPMEKMTAASKNSSFSVCSLSGGGNSAVTDGFERQGQISSQDQSPVVELGKDPEVRIAGNTLQPVEVSSVDRSQMDATSLSQQNVVFLNDCFWPGTRALYRNVSGSVADRSEVEKRQERRDKRKKIHALPVAYAKDIAGYVGSEKTLEELIDYITKTDGKDGVLKRRTSRHNHLQNESNKPSVGAKSVKQGHVLKAKSEQNRTTEPIEFSIAASSVDGLVSSDSVDGSEKMFPGSGSPEMLAPSGGELLKSVTQKTVSREIKGLAKTSDGLTSKQKEASLKTLQCSTDNVNDDSSGNLFQTRIIPNISTGFGPKVPPAAVVNDTRVEMINSSLHQPSDLEVDVTAATKLPVDAEGMMTCDDRSSTHTNKSMSTKIHNLYAEITQPGEKGVLLPNAKGPIASDAVMSVLPHPNDQPEPNMAAIPSSGTTSNSEYSYLDEDVLLSEDGPWEEFQSKKKRSRKRASQSGIKNSVLSTQKSSSIGVVPVASLKKNVSDTVSTVTMHTIGAAAHGGDGVGHNVKFSFATGGFSKKAHLGHFDGSVRSVSDVDSCDRLSELEDVAAGNSTESANGSRLSDDIVPNQMHETEFPGAANESAVYGGMAEKEFICYSSGIQTSPVTSSLSYSGKTSETVFAKNADDAKILDKLPDCKGEAEKKKSQEDLDRLDADIREKGEVSGSEKRQLYKQLNSKKVKEVKTETTNDNKSSHRLAENLSMNSQISDALVRPAVVFCGKAENQFNEENSGISFEYCDDLATGHSASSCPSSDIATSPIADVHAASGCCHQMPKSCEAASSSSGGINSGRPIAPLSGTGHTLSTRPPVLVVSPLPKVLQEEQTTSHIADADPEMLKEATVKEPASQTSVSSMLTGLYLAQNIDGNEELVLSDSNVVALSNRSLQSEISGQESTQNWKTSSQMPTNVAQKKYAEQSHARRTRSFNSASKTLAFKVLEAASYLANDWERLSIEGSTIYYSPEKQ